MSAPNRVSSVIQALGLKEGRPSRSSFSRSPPGASEAVADKNDHDIGSAGGGSEQQAESSNTCIGQGQAQANDETIRATTATSNDYKPEAQLSHDSAVPEPLFAPKLRPFEIQFSDSDSRDRASFPSVALTDSTLSSFASPLVLPIPPVGLHPRFNSLASEETRTGLNSIYASSPRLPSLALPHEDRPFIASPLSSHPPDPALIPRRAATLPSRRHASFSALPIDTDRANHWEGKDVIATPYPGRTDTQSSDSSPVTFSRGHGSRAVSNLFRHSSDRRRPRSSSKAKDSGRRRNISHRRSRPREESLTITVQDIATGSVRSSELFVPTQPGPRVGRPSHDDEEFAYRLRDSYLALRGPWKSLFLARGVTGVHLHLDGHEDDDEGKTTERCLSDHVANKSMLGQDPHAVGKFGANGLCHDLLTLFHAPQDGKQLATVLDKVNSAARNSHGAATIQLVEGWSVPRIALACGFVLLASILAMLLWVMLGVGEQARFEILNATAAAQGGSSPLHVISQSSKGIPKLPGDRVEAGAALGLLVLFLGWSTVAMWMFLSYLVG